MVSHMRDFEPTIVTIALGKDDLVHDHVTDSNSAWVNWRGLPQEELFLLLIIQILEVATRDPLLEFLKSRSTRRHRGKLLAAN